MSAETFLFRFVDGELAELDVERFRRLVEPYVVAGTPDLGDVLLRAEDGGTAEFSVRGGAAGVPATLTATHLSHGAVLDVLARLAETLGAVILPVGGAALILHEDQRRHLPPALRAEALVVAPTGAAVSEAIRRS
ncbi:MULTISPECIES: hypothetical protein [unclassified Streptomyces]|uniref:hypothetical protein n=1 Tax=unclassified Streptomyces TaxID=2593676 RepID=UPI0006F74BD4|nr:MULTISPECIES: hypothetical protein [unclassified Streptomyces]KQX57838.1 hypothetical protein ASD33_25350 [Streptomyces sp. Root1304]KRA78722.1 hypothetical protein ASE09_22905 [Streptomyces sp. Root66D1]